MDNTIMKVASMTNFSWLTIFLLTFVAGLAETQLLNCYDLPSFRLLRENDLQKGLVIITGVSSFVKQQGSVCPNDFLGTRNGLVINRVFNIDEYPKRDDFIECRYWITCDDKESFQFQLVIQDDNDESPVFTVKAPTSLNVNENWGIGQDVYKFVSDEVNDPDYEDTPNADRLQLLIVSSTPEANVFDVSGNLGIKLLRSLDYQDPSRRRYNLVLQLKDQNNNVGPVHNLVINIQDGNDQRPVLTSSSYKLSITQDVR